MHVNLQKERSYFLGIHEPDVQSILPEVVQSEMTFITSVPTLAFLLWLSIVWWVPWVGWLLLNLTHRFVKDSLKIFP